MNGDGSKEALAQSTVPVVARFKDAQFLVLNKA
jgi:hypothetical protein